MFRFPFRKHTSQISSTIYNEGMVEQLKKDLKKNGRSLLLFLNNVKKIRFLRIDEKQDTPCEEVVITRTPADADNLVRIDTTICHNGVKDEVTEHWIVSIHKTKLDHIYDKISQPAVSSIACQLRKTSHSQYEVVPVDGSVFCYLPLSVPPTGLPVHVSANFAVMSNRSGIWTSASSGTPSDKREWWNQQLMMTVIPTAYCKLLNMLKSLQQEEQLTKYQFHLLLPLMNKLSIQYPWEIMIKTLFTNLLQEDLIYSRFSNEWIELKECQFLSQSILSFQINNVPECVIDSLFIMKLPIVDIPQLYLDQLKSIIGNTLNMFNQTVFCSTFMKMIDVFDEEHETRNKVLFNMFVTAASEIAATQDSELVEILQGNPCIPALPTGFQLKIASKLVDPKSILKKLFDDDNEVFPIKTFSERVPVHRLMITVGLLTTRLPWDMVLDCAKSIPAVYEVNQKTALLRVSTLMKVIEENIEEEGASSSGSSLPLIAQLKETRFIPVAGKPEHYILPWKGQDMKLASPCESFYPSISKSTYTHSSNIKKDCVLLGSQKVMINSLPIAKSNGCGEIPETVLKFLNIQTKPTFEDVLANYECLISTYQELKPIADKNVINTIDYTCKMTIRFMNEEICVPSSFRPWKTVPAVVQETITQRKHTLSTFHHRPFVWSGAGFICPDSISQKWKEKGPRLYEVPPALVEHEQLIEALCIVKQFSIEKLLDTLKEIYNEFGVEELPENYRQLINAIISEFNNLREVDIKEYCKENQIFLPSSTYALHLSQELSLNDTPWLPVDEDCILVHTTLKRDIAVAMDVQPIRSQFLDKYCTSAAGAFGGLPFGQREELTQRIKNIIRDYPFDATLLKELLQNADDAKATKMCVILDKRKHQKTKLPSENWSKLQGPALLVWNNQEFSEEDIKGIQKLGLGSKRDDSGSIGQFGIGFNVVYHLTDCPSFISGGKTLCVFDPHCKYAPGTNHRDPGRRYDNVGDEFWDGMSDMKDTYLQGKPLNNQPDGLQNGALFRFPLRCTKEHIMDSDIIENKVTASPLTPEALEKDLDDWIVQIKDALIFLNHIVEFSYYVIEDSNPSFELKAKYEMKMDENAMQTREELFTSIKKFKLKHKRPDVFTYRVKMECSERKSVPRSYRHQNMTKQNSEEWLIQQGIGDMEKRPSEQKWCFIKQVLPKHGLAVPISRVTNFNGKLFCFLPLPGISGLPVHVNGQFVLSSNRRTLWAGDNEGKDERKEWNDSLIEAIASSYVCFLEEVRNVIVEDKDFEDKGEFYQCINQFYQLFPIWRSPSTKAEQQELMLEKNCYNLAQLVFKKLWEKNSEILAVEIFTKREECKSSLVKVEWNCLSNEEDSFKQVYFPPSCDDKTKRNAVIKLLQLIKMNLTCASRIILNHFELTNVKPAIASPKSAFDFFCNFHESIFMNVCCPCLISETPFKTAETFYKFVVYIMNRNEKSELEFQESPFNRPLLLTADEYIRFFNEDVKVMRTHHFKLFQNSLSSFQHSQFLSVSMCSSYFIKPAEIQYSDISNLLEDNYSRELIGNSCDNSNNSIITAGSLKSLWQGLLCNRDQFLFRYLSDILQSWSLIPAKSGWLYSISNEVIPMAEPTHFRDRETFQVLVKIGFPVLDTSCFPHEVIPANDTISKLIPTLNDHDRVLSMVYHLHTSQNVLDNIPSKENYEGVLLEYFSRTSLSRDQHTKNQLLSLPLFKTIDGQLTNLLNKQVYRWPGYCFCKAGFDKWALNDTAVFLEYSGDWRKLTTDFNSIGKQLNEREIYSKFILPQFSELSPDERHAHLEYIKDNMYHSIEKDIERVTASHSYYATSSDNIVRCNEARVFLDTLKALKCLLCTENDQLKSIGQFCDHRVQIFQCFPQDFNFLPKKYCNGEWMKFFLNLGLQKEVQPVQFIELCRKLENGLCKDPKRVSKVLVMYLFDVGHLWDSSYHHQIGNICFIQAVDLLKLSWIAPQCSPPQILQSTADSDTSPLALTSLNKAVVYKHAALIWTVKPVVKLPDVHSIPQHVSNYTQEYSERFLSALQVITTPTTEDVLQNLINLSTSSGLTNQDLLSKYDPQLAVKERNEEDGKIHVVKVFREAFTFLHQRNATPSLAQLQDLPCIPVSADSSTDEDIPSKVVLVKPICVVDQMQSKDKALVPYINEVPNCLKPHMSSLTAMGVRKDIGLIHIQHLFKMLHGWNASIVDPNQLSVIRCGLFKLKDILQTVDTNTSADKSTNDNTEAVAPLYLPTKEGNQWCLKLSSELVFAKSSRYISKDLKKFDFHNTIHRLFQIPKETTPSSIRGNYRTQALSPYEHSNQAAFKITLQEASKISQLLPESIRPRMLSLYTVERKLPGGNDSKELVFFNASLLEMQKHLPQLEGIITEVIEKHYSAFESEATVTKLMSILSHLEIHVIKGLQAQVCIANNQVGTLTNPSLLLEKDEEHYNLYLSESVGTEKHTWQELSEYILMELAVLLNKPSKDDMFPLMPLLTECCQVQSNSSLESLAQQYGVRLGLTSGYPNSDDDDDELDPVLGEKMPDVFVDMLDSSNDNIYRPEEWVGYETTEENFIWAIIIHEVGGENENHSKQYKILASKSDHKGIIVDALVLYKILTPDFACEGRVGGFASETKEIVLFDKDSPNATVATEIDIQTLKEDIEKDLDIAWKISDEKIKKQAIRRLLRKYHPDKAGRLGDQYEEAFKFLLAQIEKREKEELMNSSQLGRDVDRTFSSFTTNFDRWTAQAARRRPKNSFSKMKRNRTKENWFQTKPSPRKATCWFKQAEADYGALQVMKASMSETGSHVCQVMFLSHEIIEKSLKAGMYTLFGLNSSSGAVNEDICCNAERICSKEPTGQSLHRRQGQGGNVSLVDITKKVSPYFKSVRYPSIDDIPPVDVYSQAEAEEAAEFAEIVIEFVQTTCVLPTAEQ